MKIIPTFITHKRILPLFTAVSLMVPLKTAKETTNLLPNVFNSAYIIPNSKSLHKNVIQGLKIIKSVNFQGGVSYMFDSLSVKILKDRIMRQDSQIVYKLPIKNTKNVYLEPFGMFGADRPNGKDIRPHLGLDIFVSPYSRKPKSPVTIYSPIDGVVISHKRARKDDNVISNCITMLGVDGRKYSFDHMARPTDYKDSIPLPTVGTIINAGDKIGYVGATGETTMWHLHLIVMTDEELQKQVKNQSIVDMAKKSDYCPIRGQVNPLSEKDAGPIAKLLNEYRVKK